MQLDELVPYVLAELPGCPEFFITRIFREELANLYREHALWLHTDTAAAIDTDGVVTFTLPTCTEVHEVRSMRIGDDYVTPVGPQSKNDEDLEDVADTPLYVFERNFTWIVRPKPTEATTAHCVLQIGPTMIADCIEDSLAARHRTLWEHMVLMRLLSMPGQTWTNMKGASVHAAEYTRLFFEARRRIDGWTARRVPVVAYGGI